MKETIIDATYNDKIGVSRVTKGSRYGVFTGVACVSDEDLDVANKWDGQMFAEFKADIKIQKARVKALYQRSFALNYVFDAMDDDGSKTYKKLGRQALIAKRKYEAEKKRLDRMVDYYPEMCDAVLKTRRHVRGKTGQEKQ